MCRLPPCVCVSPILCVGYKYNILHLTWLNVLTSQRGLLKIDDGLQRQSSEHIMPPCCLQHLYISHFKVASPKLQTIYLKWHRRITSRCNLRKGAHLPPGFYSWGSCDQMFLQQGLLSSVVSALVLFRDTALMEPRTTSLLLTFLWISEAKKWI